jgi:8-amino-7-oxononanoate synthase
MKRDLMRPVPIEEFISGELAALRGKKRYRTLPAVGTRTGRHITVNGRALLNLSSNDYLGIGEDRGLLSEYLLRFGAENADGRYMLTASSSRLLTGNHPLYGELEETIADLYGAESSLVFNSGYHANIGILPAVSTRHDLILCDRLNHASIIDGIMLAEADYKRYRHCDYDHLEELLHQFRDRYSQVYIVTESVFSMDGDLADLQRLVELKRKYRAVLVVDEAHGAGVFGKNGLGLCEDAGVVNEVDVLIGTFGKALASTGAYAVMKRLFREYLINTMRPLIFTTALPPIVLGWSLLVIRHQRGMHRQRQHLLMLAAKLRDELRSGGFDVPGESHIVPVVFGENDRTVAMAEALRQEGFLALPVRPPTVPENRSRVRFSLRANLEWEDVERLPKIMKPRVR